MHILEYLTSRKLTKKEFGRMCGVSHSAVNNYCLGHRLPNLLIGRTIEIVTAGEVRIDDLINFWKSFR